MKFIDLHCDTLMMGYFQQETNLYEMPGMLDIKRMQAAGQLAQFFAIFMPPPGVEKMLNLPEPIDDNAYIDYSMNIYQTTLAENSSLIAAAGNAADIEANAATGKMSALLTFEDGRPIDGKLENLKHYYDKGIRLISLTWNMENCFGFPNSTDAAVMSKGIKPFGKEAIAYMNELGIIIDVSHLSDGGFEDVWALSKKPFVASHSNCRALSPHQRNLTDDMIRKLADKGGVAGINFGPEFLNADLECKDSTVALMVKHIRRMIDLGGVECVALGSDFDGVGGNLEVSSPDKMHLIFDHLSREGLGDDVIEKIAWKNVMRVIRDTL